MTEFFEKLIKRLESLWEELVQYVVENWVEVIMFGVVVVVVCSINYFISNDTIAILLHQVSFCVRCYVQGQIYGPEQTIALSLTTMLFVLGLGGALGISYIKQKIDEMKKKK